MPEFRGANRKNTPQWLPDLPAIGEGTRLHYCDGNHWELRDESGLLERYQWSQLRYSVSWKGYCFRDQVHQAKWEAHGDGLTIEIILDTFEKDLQHRGEMKGTRPEPDQFARMMVETYIAFPSSGSSA